MKLTVFITGICGGIGQGISLAFREAGWRVIGIDLFDSDKDLKNCDHYEKVDVSSAASVATYSQSLMERGEKLSCLINNAAIQVEKNVLETDDVEWNKVFSTNIGGIFNTTKYLFPFFHNASIVNISSVHARSTSPGLAAYVASKGAISALTRAMALELAPHNIRVNAIIPGAFDTPMLKQGLLRSSDPQEARKKLIQSAPLKRIGDPKEVGHLALFLADNNLSSNITGQEFVCDSGVLSRLASE